MDYRIRESYILQPSSVLEANAVAECSVIETVSEAIENVLNVEANDDASSSNTSMEIDTISVDLNAAPSTSCDLAGMEVNENELLETLSHQPNSECFQQQKYN